LLNESWAGTQKASSTVKKNEGAELCPYTESQLQGDHPYNFLRKKATIKKNPAFNNHFTRGGLILTYTLDTPCFLTQKERLKRGKMQANEMDLL